MPVLPRQGRVRRLQGHNVTAQVHLGPGQDPVAPHHGRLEWREWETEGGGKRQAVDIVADSVQFLGGPADGAGGGGGYSSFTPTSDVPADTADFQPAGATAGNGTSAPAADDDIPF